MRDVSVCLSQLCHVLLYTNIASYVNGLPGVNPAVVDATTLKIFRK